MDYLRLTSRIAAVTLTIVGLTSGIGQVADPVVKATASVQDRHTIEEFERSAKAYLAIQHNAPSSAHLKRTTDVEDIEMRRQELKKIIREARPNAKQADIFTQPVAALIRKLLADTTSGPDGATLRQSLQHGEPVAAAEAMKISVNGDYPNLHGQPLQSAPGSLLQHLPVLQKGVEYRMVGSTLVLRDTEANLVVDYLPNALR
jgi:hypothetical protein